MIAVVDARTYCIRAILADEADTSFLTSPDVRIYHQVELPVQQNEFLPDQWVCVQGIWSHNKRFSQTKDKEN